MSEQNTYVEDLKALRSQLVDLRRAHAQYGVQNGSHEDAADHLIKLQEQIQAIDDALKDEARLAPSVYATRGVLGA